MSQTDMVKAAVIRTLNEIEPQIDGLNNLISLEIKVMFDGNTHLPRKVQVALHTARLTAARP